MKWVGMLVSLAVLGLMMGALPQTTAVAARTPLASLSSSLPIDNFSTPDRSGITHIAITPNGQYVAATSSRDHAYLFNANPFSQVAVWSLPGNATSVSMSGSGPSGSPEVLLTVNDSVYLYSVSSANGSPPVWIGSGFYGDGKGVKATVVDARFSTDGSAFVVASRFVDPNSSLPGFNVSYFTTTSSGATLTFYSVVTGENFVDISVDQDGSWFIVGANDEQGNAQVFVYSGSQGAGGKEVSYSGEWSPIGGLPNPGPANNIHDAVVSQDGSHMFATGVSGMYAATVASHQQLLGNTSNLYGDGVSVSSSANGCEVLVLAGSRVVYLNASASSGCSTFGVAWTANFPSSPTSAILASSTPGYFEVSWSTNEVGWYYLYPGMPASYIAAYREMSTASAIGTIAFAADETTLAVGEAYQVSSSPTELTIAPDAGIPTPLAASVLVTPLVPPVGSSSATISVDWSVPGVIAGFTGVTLSVEPLAPGSGNTILPLTFSTASPGPQTVTGLSFSTNYTITVTLSAFDGVRTSTSTPVVVQTDAPPAAADPFTLLEFGSIALVAAGLVAYVVWRHLEQSRGEAG